MILIFSHPSFAVWDISSKKAKRIYHNYDCGGNILYINSRFKGATFSLNSRYLATIDGGLESIKISDIISRKRLVYLRRQPVFNAILTFSPDSKQLAISLAFSDKGVRTTNVEVWDIASGSGTNTIVLHDTHFGNIARIEAWDYFDQTKAMYFDPNIITFSDNNHLILVSKRYVAEGNYERGPGEIYKPFNIKVILTMNPKSGLNVKCTMTIC